MLYKYSCQARFFESGLIRFTPPCALNDPDEARPELLIGKHAPEDYARAREAAQRNGLTELPDRDLEQLFMKPFPSERYDDKYFPTLWPAKEERLRDEPFSTLEELDRAIAERAIETCLATADRTLGVLSLSASTSEPMWAYYANDHRGIAIEFDEGHEFFRNNLQKVVYSDDPIHVTTKLGRVRIGGVEWDNNDILDGRIDLTRLPLDLFLRKRHGWICEQECRMFQNLKNAKLVSSLDENNHRVHLFEIPSNAVKKLIFGYRADDHFIQKTLKSTSQERWKHLSITRRQRSKLGKIEEVHLI